MRRMYFIFISVFLLTISCRPQNNESVSQSEDEQEDFVHEIPGDGTKSCSPYFFVKSNDPSQSWMPLQSTRTSVDITGAIANVKVEQTYVNKSKKTLDAIYIFPGSTRAAVYGLDMTVGKRTIHAKVMEKEDARKNFEEAKKEGKRATLLEQDRPNVFKTEVTNIKPGDIIKVEMFYTELLEYRDKEYEFVYPTAVGPRYSTTNEEYVIKSIEQLESGHQPKFDISVTIDGAIPVQQVESSTHQIKINRESNTCTKIGLSNPSDTRLGKDFILKYGLQGGRVESGLTLYEHGDEKFFLFMMQPPKSVAPEEILPREYIFIVDVSGSMSGFPLDISKAILRKLIGSLKKTDRFNVLLFESSNSMMSQHSLPATKDNIDNAIRLINRQGGSGGTRLLPALKKALEYNDPSLKNYARTFIIATDGFVSVEPEAFQLISEKISDANFFPLGIGNQVNRYLIEGMAWAGASEPFIIENITEAEKTGDHLIKTISQPIYSQISIDWGDFRTYDIYPEKVPDIYSERPIVIFGKYQGKPEGTIRIKGKTAEGDLEQFIPVSEASQSKNEALRYLWARNKIKYLSDYASIYKGSYSEQETNKKEITRLGLTYNLLTAYTSFLAVDESDTGILDEHEAQYEETAFCSPRQSIHFTPPVIQDEKVAPVRKDQEKESQSADQIYHHVEQMPEFPGGQAELTKFINTNLKYPVSAQEQGIEGTVVLRFTIDKNGDIKDIQVIRSLDPECDKEAIRIIRSMPRWIPGKHNGKGVDIYFTVPVRFKINN